MTAPKRRLRADWKEEGPPEGPITERYLFEESGELIAALFLTVDDTGKALGWDMRIYAPHGNEITKRYGSFAEAEAGVVALLEVAKLDGFEALSTRVKHRQSRDLTRALQLRNEWLRVAGELLKSQH